MRFDWKEVEDKLASVAKPAASAVSAVAGGTPIGIGAALVARALNVPATPEAITHAIETDPLAGQKIALAEARIAEAMAGDMKNARETFKDSRMPAIVFGVTSLMVALLFICAGGLVLLGNIQITATGEFRMAGDGSAGMDTSQAWDFLKTQGAQIFIVWVGAAGYFVSSSLGSRNKEAIIDRRIT